jgi:hypothetical protein
MQQVKMYAVSSRGSRGGLTCSGSGYAVSSNAECAANTDDGTQYRSTRDSGQRPNCTCSSSRLESA